MRRCAALHERVVTNRNEFSRTAFVGPLGLTIGADGTVYVMDSFAQTLFSVRDGETEVVATGPMSGGVDAAGRGQVVYTTRESDDEGEEPGPATAASLVCVTASGHSREIASLLDDDATANPDSVNTYGFVDLDAECAAEVEAVFGPGFAGMYPGQVDSNPYAVAIHKGGYLVADAGGNTIVRVDANGRTSTVAVLPSIETTIGPEVLEFGGQISQIVDGVVSTLVEAPTPGAVEVARDGTMNATIGVFGAGQVVTITP